MGRRESRIYVFFNTLDSGSSPGSTKPVPGLTRYPGSARNDSAFSLSKCHSCQRSIEPKNQVHHALPECTLFVLVAIIANIQDGLY